MVRLRGRCHEPIASSGRDHARRLIKLTTLQFDNGNVSAVISWWWNTTCIRSNNKMGRPHTKNDEEKTTHCILLIKIYEKNRRRRPLRRDYDSDTHVNSESRANRWECRRERQIKSYNIWIPFKWSAVCPLSVEFVFSNFCVDFMHQLSVFVLWVVNIVCYAFVLLGSREYIRIEIFFKHILNFFSKTRFIVKNDKNE